MSDAFALILEDIKQHIDLLQSRLSGIKKGDPRALEELAEVRGQLVGLRTATGIIERRGTDEHQKAIRDALAELEGLMGAA